MDSAKVKIHFNKSGSHPAIGKFDAMTTASVDADVARYLVETVNLAAYASERTAAEAAAEAGTTVDPVQKNVKRAHGR